MSRIIAAASLGALIWTGCAPGPGPRYAADHRAVPVTGVDRQAIMEAPINMINRRPDTHPHLRGGLWQYGYRVNEAGEAHYSVVENPGAPLDVPPGYADTPIMLVFNPEVINVAAAMREPTAGTIIRDAAGAPAAEQPPIAWEVRAYEEELVHKLEQHLQQQRTQPWQEDLQPPPALQRERPVQPIERQTPPRQQMP
jgi:hypothetical protein